MVCLVLRYRGITLVVGSRKGNSFSSDTSSDLTLLRKKQLTPSEILHTHQNMMDKASITTLQKALLLKTDPTVVINSLYTHIVQKAHIV